MLDTLVTFTKTLKFISAAWHLSSKETGKQLPIFEVSVSDAGQISVGTREDNRMGAGGADSSSQRSQSACQWGRLSESCCTEIRRVPLQPWEEQAFFI